MEKKSKKEVEVTKLNQSAFKDQATLDEEQIKATEKEEKSGDGFVL